MHGSFRILTCWRTAFCVGRCSFAGDFGFRDRHVRERLAHNPNIDSTARILWLVGMVLLHPFVAIVYYFTDYKKAS